MTTKTRSRLASSPAPQYLSSWTAVVVALQLSLLCTGCRSSRPAATETFHRRRIEIVTDDAVASTGLVVCAEFLRVHGEGDASLSLSVGNRSNEDLFLEILGVPDERAHYLGFICERVLPSGDRHSLSNDGSHVSFETAALASSFFWLRSVSSLPHGPVKCQMRVPLNLRATSPSGRKMLSLVGWEGETCQIRVPIRGFFRTNGDYFNESVLLSAEVMEGE